ncbi:helix-turn-helix transcriptional regulator [Pseudomonas sp. UL073]|uniref:Helix-turn-helix transcriptional regulator n=1 Tax=Zestomonas insulae TaxID=2809017 RepID=A0ABS2ICR6_9GAMM|nr:helix-turn-helix transcriptional regulator [Pseudomonas insulae]MBM7059707.1 helix-turn-helix transcriptional regulator [Pseudomonas insulae]
MNVQVIKRDGEAEYAVLPWAEYQELLRAAGRAVPEVAATPAAAPSNRPMLAQLAALREQKGLSAEQLARAVGISPHYLAMIERGERQPDAAIRRALSWNLGVDGWGDEM